VLGLTLGGTLPPLRRLVVVLPSAGGVRRQARSIAAKLLGQALDLERQTIEQDPAVDTTLKS